MFENILNGESLPGTKGLLEIEVVMTEKFNSS